MNARSALALVGRATLVAVVTNLILVSAAEARKYGRAGCGLGSLIIAPSGNQSSAAISNGSSGNQYFAISSGTSNCIPSRQAAAMENQEQFIMANLMSLSKDIAQGSGETLEAFVGVLGCEKNNYPMIASRLQASYASIFAAPGAISVLDTAKAELREDAELASGCQWL